MNKKEIKHAYKLVLEAAYSLKCENMHHSKKNRHESGSVCPVEYELHNAIHIVKEHMKETINEK